ncbi:MAG: NADH-quinone oxidoreductase subunit L [archaeon]|nr:NADH-quinone oxidoreductase subunit L [archaeon]
MLEYAYLIPLVPAICFVIVGLFGKKTPEGGGYIAILGSIISCILSIAVSYEYLTGKLYSTGRSFEMSVEWLTVAGFKINFGIYVDILSCAMMFFASLISMLIFIYSLGYMKGEGERKRRYYAEVSLFLTGMLGLVVSSNFLEMFIFWEIMGLCSYLLIGFWSFDNPDAQQKSSAAKKAFLVTRLGDVCLMGGLFILLYVFHTLDYTAIFGRRFFSDSIFYLGKMSINHYLLFIALFLILGGAVGKSAQFPLHDWLPDAMAGPTTVSALIHAATMVKAGVYLLARTSPLFIICHRGNMALIIVAGIGAITAFFAATMALNNMNIKKVLAYSTLSQLGYMFLGLGTGSFLIWYGFYTISFGVLGLGAIVYFAAVFHMFNHAFFKALLFLGSGSVIHSCGTEDMRLMGGLVKKMRTTAVTMLVGALSISGFPLLSGFWSKDMILEAALVTGEYLYYVFTIFYILGMAAAFMTAFYMFRMWFMTFSGEPRENAQHCHGESPSVMTFPLYILAAFAMFSGVVVIYALDSVWQTWFGTNDILEIVLTSKWTPISVMVALVGIFVADLMYRMRVVNPGWFNRNGKGIIYRILADRYHIPQLYDYISWKIGYGVACIVDYFDRNVVDGVVNGLSNVVIGNADVAKKMETGYVRDYTLLVAVGVFVLVLTLFAVVKGVI